ncbi:uncharacterized protein LOC110054246 [Orbicella faveolata]|uniref:uncharacterized protein LOC110054246 n=1 Tax=Orbicella faveolata TaxID=48498 RepID=UPI0009E30DD8|nr:uncharacterized protein LOC110054246 [Orbicella faveolata]
MLGRVDIANGKRVLVILEIDESRKDEVIRLLQETEVGCEVVSVRRIQSGNARKRFAVPSDDEPLRPSPVHLFPSKNEEAVAIYDNNQSSRAAPPQVQEYVPNL